MAKNDTKLENAYQQDDEIYAAIINSVQEVENGAKPISLDKAFEILENKYTK